MAPRIPNAQLVIYEDAGHGGIFQNYSDFVSEALAFLGRDAFLQGGFFSTETARLDMSAGYQRALLESN